MTADPPRSSVSDQIRALAAQGRSRAEIARMLGKRYQHVRNVLEGDKLRAGAGPADDEPPGLQEASEAFGGVHRLSVEADGRVRLPPEVLAALGARPGGVLIALSEPDRLAILSTRAAWARIDDMMQPFRRQGGPLASDELIAERRAEAAREADD